MQVFRVQVGKIFFVEHYVLADDYDHAMEIGSEIEMMMPTDDSTFQDAEWQAIVVSQDHAITYEPEQDYLK